MKDGKLHVSGALGTEGFLTVFKDVGLDEPYQGIVKLRTGEIAEDIAYYLAESEQIPSAVGLGVFVETDGRVSAAGGFLIQTLPPSEETTIDQLIANIRKVRSVTEVLREGKTPEDLLGLIFEGIPCETLEKKRPLLPLHLQPGPDRACADFAWVCRADAHARGARRGRGGLRILPGGLPFRPGSNWHN